jgi:protein tyrosine/serine phosphatase
MGVDYTDPVFEAKIKTALLFINSHSGPYLIHGNEGRDRTGFLAALLEALMGAGAEEIRADYMKSYENYYHLTPDNESYLIISVIAEDILLTITGRRAAESVDLKEAAEQYLRDRIGLDAEECAALRARLGE